MQSRLVSHGNVRVTPWIKKLGHVNLILADNIFFLNSISKMHLIIKTKGNIFEKIACYQSDNTSALTGPN